MQPVPTELIETWKAERRAGHKVRTIAKRYRYTPQTVSKYTAAEHIPLTIRRASDDEIVKCFRAGMSTKETAEKTGVTYSKAYRVGRRENVVVRKWSGKPK